MPNFEPDLAPFRVPMGHEKSNAGRFQWFSNPNSEWTEIAIENSTVFWWYLPGIRVGVLFSVILVYQKG